VRSLHVLATKAFDFDNIYLRPSGCLTLALCNLNETNHGEACNLPPKAAQVGPEAGNLFLDWGLKKSASYRWPEPFWAFPDLLVPELAPALLGASWLGMQRVR
jgi:hypothetical protein